MYIPQHQLHDHVLHCEYWQKYIDELVAIRQTVVPPKLFSIQYLFQPPEINDLPIVWHGSP